MSYCKHVYQEVEQNPCEFCGKESHKTDWKLQNELQKEWKESNPEAKYGGWWSI
jgi:hypothetical protein